jgi:hypothetical protein
MKAVFIGGCDRSGTTMLGSMLGAHDMAICSPETNFLTHLFRRREFAESKLGVKEALRITSNERFQLLWSESVGERFLDLVRNEEPVNFRRFVLLLVQALAEKECAKDVSMWIDHTPSNFKRISMLRRNFPDAKFIHIIRDGRGVANSLLGLEWGPNDILRAAEFWMARVSAGLAAERTSAKGSLVTIQYEQVVREPGRVLGELCEFLDISYQDVMIAGGSFVPSAYSARQHSLVGQPPRAERSNRWKNALDDWEVEAFELITGEMLRELGYSMRYGLAAKPITPKNMCRVFVQRLFGRVSTAVQQQVRRLRFR